MNNLSADIIDELSQYAGTAVLTIYFPTHKIPTPPNVTENQTRYKNMIRSGFEQWRQRLDDPVLDMLERQLEEKTDDMAFWQDASCGVGIFASTSGVSIYRLPVEVAEQVYVGSTYDILPLLHIKTMDQPYYLFALALHDPKIFKGDLYGLEPIDMDFPHSPEDALNIDEMFINSNTYRAGSGGLATHPHGQGDSQQAGQEERLMYFRMLDQIIMASQQIDHDCPILIAATESEAGDYATVSRLKNLLDSRISGNRTKTDVNELHRLASEVIFNDVVSRRMREIAKEYERHVGAEKATSDPDDIERAAQEGRIDRLLVGAFERSNDSVSTAQNATVLTTDYTGGMRKENILLLVKNVLKNGGHIEMFNRYLMPERALLAALYRY